MNYVVSRKSVVPIHAPSSNLCALVRNVRSSITLNVLPELKKLPLSMRMLLRQLALLGPPATLKGVKKARRADV